MAAARRGPRTAPTEASGATCTTVGRSHKAGGGEGDRWRTAEAAPSPSRRRMETPGPSSSRATRTRPVVQRRFGAARFAFVDLPEARSGVEWRGGGFTANCGGHSPPLRGSGSRRPPAATPGAVVERTADGRARRGPGTYSTPCHLFVCVLARSHRLSALPQAGGS